MSRLPSLPTTHPSFLKHRFHDDNPLLPLKISSTAQLPPLAWASLPTPPMSGTPPPDPPSEPPQLAGRRRKREDTPPTSATTELPANTTPGLNTSPLIEQSAQRYGEYSRVGRASEPVIMSTPRPIPWEHQSAYGTGSGVAFGNYTAATYPLAGPGQVSPRSTRKNKAHVASACINCKKKHLRCDESRPCRRCVQSGKEDTCRDVEHKKRGRPPLKPEDPSATRMARASITLPALGSGATRTGVPGSSAYPPLLPQPNPARFSYPSAYAPPSIGHSPAMALGQMTSARDLPRLSQSHSSSETPYTIPAGASPQYGYYQPQSMASQPYPGAIFPRPSPSQHGSNDIPAGYYGTSSLQLPPILPAPAGASMRPALAQQQHYSQTMGHPQPQAASQIQTYGQGAPLQTQSSEQDRDSKRPKMDIQGILGPRE